MTDRRAHAPDSNVDDMFEGQRGDSQQREYAVSAGLHRIVVATDLSDASLHAARWVASRLARGAEIILTHVVAIPRVPRFITAQFGDVDDLAKSAAVGATQRLHEIAACFHSSRVSTQVRVGSSAEQIVDVARASQADLIVVGRHGQRPGLAHRLGTTVERVVHASPVPVLLATSMRDTSPRRILAAVDESDAAAHVVEWARFLACELAAEVTGLHVVHPASLQTAILRSCLGRAGTDASPAIVPPSETRERIIRHGEAWLRETLGHGWQPDAVDVEIAFGWVAHEIVSTAERRNSELIIVGRPALPGGHLVPGTITRQVLRTALCPVLVVTEPSVASGTPTAGS